MIQNTHSLSYEWPKARVRIGSSLVFDSRSQLTRSVALTTPPEPRPLRLFGLASTRRYLDKEANSKMSFLPSATSWFPGHMATFTRHLPALLGQTHVVLEVRDVRLPLTSINPTLEAALEKWKKGRKAAGSEGVCERIVVYTKRDLIDGGETVSDSSTS